MSLSGRTQVGRRDFKMQRPRTAAWPVQEVELTASRLRWAFLAAVYAAFLVWYGGSGDPISPEEVEKYVAIAEARNSGPDDARARISFATIRLVPLLLLIVVGLLVDRIGARSRVGRHPGPLVNGGN